MNRARSGAAGALLGAIPGAVLVLLTVPVTGEAELTNLFMKLGVTSRTAAGAFAYEHKLA